MGADHSRGQEEKFSKQYPSPSPSSSSRSPSSHISPRSSKNINNNNVPIQKPIANKLPLNTKPNEKLQNKPQLDALKSKYAKFGSKPPSLEDYAFYGVERNDLERQVERALNLKDLDLVDFDHAPYESEWKRRFPNEKTKQGIKTFIFLLARLLCINLSLLL